MSACLRAKALKYRQHLNYLLSLLIATTENYPRYYIRCQPCHVLFNLELGLARLYLVLNALQQLLGAFLDILRITLIKTYGWSIYSAISHSCVQIEFKVNFMP